MSRADADVAESIAGINATPFIDVSLVLLIVFMVTAGIAAQTRALPLDLPRAVNSEAPRSTVALRVREAGLLEVDGAAMSDAHARAALRSHCTHAANPFVVVEAEAAVTHGRVVHAMDLARVAGCSRLSIVALPTER